jgi:hypothetical protein
MYNVQASFSPGFSQQIMPYLLGTTAVLDTWTVVHMTAAKFTTQMVERLLYIDLTLIITLLETDWLVTSWM